MRIDFLVSGSGIFITREFQRKMMKEKLTIDLLSEISPSAFMAALEQLIRYYASNGLTYEEIVIVLNAEADLLEAPRLVTHGTY